MDTVICFDGSKAKKSECRYIKQDYYKIGDPEIKDSGHCYLITDRKGQSKYYRINSGYIEWDYEQEKYVLKHEESLVYGLVSGDGTMGYFTPNVFNNVYINPESSLNGSHIREPIADLITAINEQAAEQYSDFFSYVDGLYYKFEDSYSTAQINRERKYHDLLRYNNPVKLFYPPFEEVYNAEESNVWKYMQKLYKEYEPEISEHSKNLGDLVGDLTFGFECETNTGNLPIHQLYRNGIIPLRDGSIGGHEYTSIPLQGPKGVQNIVNFFKEANKYCAVNQHCSVHFHIGNVFTDKSLKERKLIMIAIYMLYYYIQNEIWEIIPPYKRSNQYFRTKHAFKDHCQPLKSLGLTYNRIYNSDGEINEDELEDSFTSLFRFLNDGVMPDSDHNIMTRRHIKDGASKWNINSRYYALNLYNAAFGNSDTVEFRAYSATTTPTRLWLIS